MKKALVVLGVLLMLALLGVALIIAVSEARLAQEHAVDFPPLPIPDDPETVARGRHLLTLAKCGECHGDDLAGKVFIDAPFVARLSGPNLTPAGAAGERSDAELVAAIRYGVGASGRALMGMPTKEHFYFSDDELSAMIAAIRALEPVQRELPPQELGLLFRLLYLAGEIELVGLEEVDIDGPRPAAVSPAVSLAYGEHLARTGGCYSCHGARLAGGEMPGAPPDFPPAANITPHADGLAGWTRRDLSRAMRSGIRPDGTAIDPAMPWRYSQAMSEDELAALWMFLQSVPPAAYGQN